MNASHRPLPFERLPALCLPDDTVLHRSSRTTMTTNAMDRDSVITCAVTSQLSMYVIRGALQVRCTGRSMLELNGALHDARHPQARR
jgi:hypothetical protein